MAATRPEANPQSDDVLLALDDLIAAIEQNTIRNRKILQRAKLLRRQRGQGRTYREIVEASDRPLIVEMLTENFDALRTYGAALRREEARALYDEGMTMDHIAATFGVTRQRISQLLAAANDKGRTTPD